MSKRFQLWPRDQWRSELVPLVIGCIIAPLYASKLAPLDRLRCYFVAIVANGTNGVNSNSIRLCYQQNNNTSPWFLKRKTSLCFQVSNDNFLMKSITNVHTTSYLWW
jgi:hypothetical protein